MKWRAALLGRGLWSLIILIAVVAIIGPTRSEAEGRRVLVHLKTGKTQDDNQMCVAFNVAQAAVEAGDQVEMFFDAAAVFDLQDAPSRGDEATSQPTSQPTKSEGPYNLKYELPDKLKRILSQQFSIPIEELPLTYFAYLEMLKGKGAVVTFNGALAHLVSLSDSVTGTESVTDIATPLNLNEILDHRAKADVYFVY